MSSPSASASYDWTTLEDDETVLWSGKPHKYSLIPAFIVGIPLSIVLIGIAIIAWAWVDRENTEYVITTQAVYRKRGALSRNVKRISFEKIQNTALKQGIFGTRFEYGNVEISTAGSEGAELTFRAVPDPRSVQRQVNGRLEEVKQHDESTTTGHDGDPDERTVALLEEIRDEVRSIGDAVRNDT